MKNSTLLAIVIGVFISAILITKFDPDELSEAIKKYDLDGGDEELSMEVLEDQFDYFVSKYKKSYNSIEEYDLRFEIFTENYEFIQEHNKKAELYGFSVGMNKFADLSDEEFADIYLSEIDVPETYEDDQSENPFNSFMKESATEKAIRDLQIPDSIDWRLLGAVTRVKDQGQCGACWAFSAIAAIEGINYKINKVKDTLSEEQLLDCARDQYKCNGCDGGYPHGAFQYSMANDLCTDSEYPYTGKAGICHAWYACSTKNILESYKNVTSSSRQELYSAIAQQPVSVAVDASSKEFRFYSSGIFSIGCEEEINHAVTAVGYSYESFFFFWRNNYILLKNSWSEEWGEKGFMRLSSNNEGGKGMCGVYLYGTYPIIKKN
jgi:C1A family cysteine protease